MIRIPIGLIASVLTLAALWGAPAPLAAQEADTTAAQQPEPTGVPVIFGRDTVVVVRARLGPYSAAERAQAISGRLQRVSRDPVSRKDSAVVVDAETTTDVMVGETIIMTITQADAESAGVARLALAVDVADKISARMGRQSLLALLKTVGLGLLFTLLATAGLLLAVRGLLRVFRGVDATLERWRGTRIPAIRLQKLELVSSSRVTDGLLGAAWVARVAVFLVVGYVYLSLVFSFFPWTRGLAGQLLDWVLEPLGRVGDGFVTFLPKLFFIAVIVVVTRYILKIIRLAFRGLATGGITIPGFPAEWAEPTYKIVRFLVIAFSAVVIFPYLPGSGSDAFKGISVFIGVLFSLGSTSAIANVVAGTVITYMRPFQLGDRVKIADTTGDVIEKTLLVTRVRTIKNVDVTIPNSMVLSSHIVNYSSSAAQLGLILHTGVTIGYDAPWRQVHELLISAAKATKGIKSEPAPFVLQTSLDDFYVSYQLNAYTDQPNRMAAIYSELHQAIQDKFNEAGVEIMSPHYGALRDGNQTTIPGDYLPKEYSAPKFRVDAGA